jgi:hypothetical protein
MSSSKAVKYVRRLLCCVRKFLSDQGFKEVLEYRGHAYFVNTRPVGD